MQKLTAAVVRKRFAPPLPPSLPSPADFEASLRWILQCITYRSRTGYVTVNVYLLITIDREQELALCVELKERGFRCDLSHDAAGSCLRIGW